MARLTKLEIQHALLGGRAISWTNVAEKLETIELKDVAQRRLFEFLLQSSVREAKGLSPEFIEGLSSAFNGKSDPAEGQTLTATASLARTWRLKKIETSGFGGLNTWGGPVFAWELDTESLILQGPNGSGKSSLIGAIIWAMTGERPRDHSNTSADERADVYDIDNQKIGTWPPIACYPASPTSLASNPYVRVELTFADDSGAVAVLERKLEEGVTSTHADPALNLPDVLIETGLLMPSRMSQIRFEKGQTPLTKAVQSLTGLDDLVDIGALTDGLCHKGREYLSGPSKLLEQKKTLFDAALAEAQRALKPTDETLQAFVPKDTEDANGAFVVFGRRLRDRAAEMTRVISQDLATGLDVSSAGTQAEISGAITSTLEDLSSGLAELATWKSLSVIATGLDDKAIEALQTAADEAEHALAEALRLDERSQHDSRLQLKALGAHWHDTHRGGELINCPLCDESLKDAALRTDIETLRRAGAAATRQLIDNLNAISSRLSAAVPAALRSQLDNLGFLAPRRGLIADITARYIARPRFQNILTSFAALVLDGLNRVPSDELEVNRAGFAGGSNF